jgi:hypothetical protein
MEESSGGGGRGGDANTNERDPGPDLDDPWTLAVQQAVSALNPSRPHPSFHAGMGGFYKVSAQHSGGGTS